MAVTHVESKMMNSSLYVPVNLKGYAYIMFGDLAVPIWGDYRGVNVTSQGALYDKWVEYFGKACHMDAFFGHCTNLMEGDHMAKIVREVMDASMDYARSDNDVENGNCSSVNLDFLAQKNCKLFNQGLLLYLVIFRGVITRTRVARARRKKF